MHDYSDAIAIVGLNNINDAIAIPTDHEKVNGNIQHTGNYALTGNLTHVGNNVTTGDITASGFIKASIFKTGAFSGVSGTFTTTDAKTVTVTNGIITSIV